MIEAAKKRGETIEHVLLYGGSGLGKTTLAHIIAKELNSNIKVTSGPAIEKIGDLASILTNLQPGAYRIDFNPYFPADEPLASVIDLAAADSDTVCVPRTHYPWGLAALATLGK